MQRGLYAQLKEGRDITPSYVKNHILIIDDSQDIHELLGIFFKDEGYRISIAENGEEALKFLAETEFLPDLILLDLMMPIMDGYQFRIEQAKDFRLTKIPVVIMTAGSDVKINSIKSQAEGFLKKPFSDLDLLLSTVSSAIHDESNCRNKKFP